MKNNKCCLIVEGGGFKTGFTTGILDAFLIAGFKPFDQFIGISGGAISLSYFLSDQYRQCIKAMKLLAKDEQFTQFTRTFGSEGYMDIDFLREVADKEVPFNLAVALEKQANCEVRFVTTNRETGQAHYMIPEQNNWLDLVIASSTLPFVTKGNHTVDDVKYFDGGWGDPLPVKWAYEQGAKKILVLRTVPQEQKIEQSYADYFASIYYKNEPKLRDAFANSHTRYNEGVEFIMNPPSDLQIEQISPIKELKSTTYSYTKKTIMSDYRYGIDKGLYYIAQQEYAL